MTIIDWILVGIFGIFIIRGIFRGFFVELSEVVAIIVGYLVARSLGPVFGAWLDNFLPLAVWITYIIAFITVFITVVVIIHILGTLLHKASKLSALGILERIAGGVFGGVRCLAPIDGPGAPSGSQPHGQYDWSAPRTWSYYTGVMEHNREYQELPRMGTRVDNRPYSEH